LSELSGDVNMMPDFSLLSEKEGRRSAGLNSKGDDTRVEEYAAAGAFFGVSTSDYARTHWPLCPCKRAPKTRARWLNKAIQTLRACTLWTDQVAQCLGKRAQMKQRPTPSLLGGVKPHRSFGRGSLSSRGMNSPIETLYTLPGDDYERPRTATDSRREGVSILELPVEL
jgi:hypothetical protein